MSNYKPCSCRLCYIPFSFYLSFRILVHRNLFLEAEKNRHFGYFGKIWSSIQYIIISYITIQWYTEDNVELFSRAFSDKVRGAVTPDFDLTHLQRTRSGGPNFSFMGTHVVQAKLRLAGTISCFITCLLAFVSTKSSYKKAARSCRHSRPHQQWGRLCLSFPWPLWVSAVSVFMSCSQCVLLVWMQLRSLLESTPLRYLIYQCITSHCIKTFSFIN